MGRISPLWYAMVIGASLLLPGVASADPTRNVLAAETSRALAEIDQDIEALRVEMGRPETGLPKLVFRNVSYDELFHLSLSLRERANNLYFEWARELLPPFDPSHKKPGEADVRKNLESVLQLLGKVAATIGVTLPAPPVEAPSLDTDQALTLLIHLSRRLNNIMNDAVGPGEVFAVVSLAVKNASDLLAHYPVTRRIPPDEPPSSGKRPADVYERLTRCLLLAGEVVRRSERQPLELVEVDFDDVTIAPGDVYDLATLNISQLDRLLGPETEMGASYILSYTGPRIPSHVYRRVGLLEAQLTRLLDIASGGGEPSDVARP